MESSSLTWVAGSATPERIYLTRLWNLATLNEWREARKQFPNEAFLDVVRHPLQGQWTRHGKAFAETVSGIQMPDDVLISYDV